MTGTEGAAAEPPELNLTRRFEERFLRQAFNKTGPVPALILTGFLGSGKTTVVNHILRTRGNLRVAVLVNEVGDLDVDSLLVDTGKNNAAVGLPSMPLAGGCACCQLSSDLSASLKQLSDRDQRFDYLVLETSGAADPAPMAEVLLQHGFHLDAVATVVDAEAAHVALALPTGLAQLEAADLIVVNKCDLAGLGALADLEDRIAQLAPSIRVVRTRFGQAPLEAIMDVREVRPGSAAAAASHLQGQLGFLSHDALPSAERTWRVGGMGEDPGEEEAPRKKARLAGETKSTRDGEGGTEGAHGGAHGHHGGLEEQEVTSVSINVERMIDLEALQLFVVHHLMKSTGVFRAKGMVWLSERRGSRATLHFHGLRRAELQVLGPWDAPPACRLVIIGRDPGELRSLKGRFCALLHEPSPLLPTLTSRQQQQLGVLPDPQGGDAAADGPEDDKAPPDVKLSTSTVHTNGGGRCLELLGSVKRRRESSGRGRDASRGAPSGCPDMVAEELRSLINLHERFEALDGAAQQSSRSSSSSPGAPLEGGGGGGSAIVRFSAIGVPLKSIDGAVVNAAVMRAVSAAGRLLLAGEVGAEALFMGSGTEQKSRVGSLLLSIGSSSNESSDPPQPPPQSDAEGVVCEETVPEGRSDREAAREEARSLWDSVLKAARPALTSAYAHAGGCSCDIGDALRAMAEARERGLQA